MPILGSALGGELLVKLLPQHKPMLVTLLLGQMVPTLCHGLFDSIAAELGYRVADAVAGGVELQADFIELELGVLNDLLTELLVFHWEHILPFGVLLEVDA